MEKIEKNRGPVIDGNEVQDDFIMKFAKAVIICFVLVVIEFVVLKTTLVLSYIPTGSMESTIKAGDIVFGTRYDTGAEDIERYDIFIFIPPDEPGITYIKRVIGLPGETIVVSNGKVYADGVELDDSFTKGPMNRRGDGTYVVPEGCYFFMGDNRNHSSDSRFWVEKYVPLENMEAKVKRIFHTPDFIKGLMEHMEICSSDR